MPVDIANREDFERLLDRLAADIVDAAIFNRLHTDLTSSQNEYCREFVQSGTFWGLILQAQVEVVLFRLIRIYDHHNRALSLQSWLDTISNNLDLFGTTPPDVQQLEQDINLVVARTDPLVKKLISLRGNTIAHINARGVVKELNLSGQFGLTFDEIDVLVSRAVTILNRYSVLFKRQSWSTVIVGHDDFKGLLKSVRRDLEDQDAQLEAEIEQIAVKSLEPGRK